MTLEDLRTSLFNKHTVGSEDRGWSHKLRNAGGLKKLKKAKQRILPQVLQKGEGSSFSGCVTQTACRISVPQPGIESEAPAAEAVS